APHVATGFPALSDNDINAGIRSPLGIGGRTDGVQYGSSSSLCARNEGRGIAPEERDDPDTLCEADFQPLLLGKFQVQIDPERLARERLCLADETLQR